MGAEAEQYVNTLMTEFRELVLGIQEEQALLKARLRDIRRESPLSPITPSPSPPTSASLTSSGVTALTALPATVSPIDDPSTTNTLSSGTNSSATGGSSSTRPPPYKSVVRVVSPVPRAPLRTKRRSNTINRLSDISDSIINNNNLTILAPPRSRSMATASVASRGALIVLEGLDRVGKSTLAAKLVEHLQKTRRSVTYSRFPDRSTPVGHLINDFLKSSSKRIDDHAMHLLFSANRWELSSEIRKTINQGTTIVLDRYAYSGIAYSSASDNISMEWCMAIESGLPKPDLVIYLELPKEAQYQRAGFGDERFETKEYQERVRARYEQLINSNSDNWLRVDVENKSVDIILAEIVIPVRYCLDSCADKELGDLTFKS